MDAPKTYAQHGRELLKLGLPLIAGNLTGFAIHMSDTIMLGWYSIEALAAGVLGSSLWFVTFILGSGFGQAVMPVVASAMAAGEDTQVRRATRMAMWLSLLFGLIVLPVFLWSAPLLALMGQPPAVARMAGIYLGIAGLGMIPALLTQVFRSYLSALERTHVIVWVTMAALIANIVINYALIFGNFGAPELGIAGAAIASVMVQVVSVAGLAVYAAYVTAEHALFQRIWRADWPAFGNIFNLGWPIGLTAFAEVGLFSGSAVLMGWLGTIQLAAHGIALQIAAIFFLFHMGLAQAGTIRVGQAWGRSDMESLRRVAIASNAISGLFALAVILIYVIFATDLIGLFMRPGEPARAEVIAAGVSLLYVAAVFQLADAGQVQALSLLRGMHDTRVPMLMATVSYWIAGLPIAYLLGFRFGLGGVGIWTGLTAALSLAWLGMGLRLWQKAFRTRRQAAV